MNELTRTLYYGNTALDWLLAIGIAMGMGLFFLLLHRWLLQRFKASTDANTAFLRDLIVAIVFTTWKPFLVLLAIVISIQTLRLPLKLDQTATHIFLVVVLLQAALWVNRGIAIWVSRYLREKRESDAASATTVMMLGFLARLAVWVVMVLMVLDNLGVNITALVASLGIVGVAAALAVQNILADLFASLSITLDKPFVIGDFIVMDDVLGTIEHIGLKTTRIRSLSGEQIVVANADLLKSRIRNFKKMYERRVEFAFRVVYNTPVEKLERLPALIRALIEQQPKTRFDRTHFKEYGESALIFEVVYFVLDPDFNLYMDIQQNINLAIFRRFQEQGIDFGFPTRTINVTPAANTPPPNETKTSPE